MAAGIGSRFGGLKQIESVGLTGEIIIDYSLYDARRAGFERVVFVIRKDIEELFRQKIAHTVENLFEIRYAYQEINSIPKPFAVPAGRAKPWGTGHAVLCAKDVVDAPFAVINADDFYGAESFKNLYKHLKRAADRNGIYDYCMVGYRLENTLTDAGHVARGVCTIKENGDLDSLVERTKIQRFDDAVRYLDDNELWADIDGQSIVSMNMFGFTPSFCSELNDRFPAFLAKNIDNPKAEFFLPSAVNELIAGKKAAVRVLPTHDEWLGVTYKQDLYPVRKAIRILVAHKVYPQKLWA